MTGKPTYEELEQRVIELETMDAERKRAEKKLQESTERYRLLAESMSDIIWTANMDLRFTYVSPSVERFIGYAPEELIGKTLLEHLTANARETATKKFIEAITLEEAMPGRSTTMTVERLHKRGSTVYGEITFAFLRDADGRPTEIVGVTRNITQQKRAEDALRESEERFRTLIETAPDGIGVTDVKGNAIYVNSPLIGLHGYNSGDEMIGRNITEFIAEEDRARVSKTIEEMLDKGLSKGIEYLYLRKDGTCFKGDLNLSVVRATDGRPMCFIGIVRDITERKRTEEELQKIEKLRSLGILAGGIAHDFNNILTPIMINISVAKMYGDLPDDIFAMLTDAEKASLRGQQMTQQLLSFAKGAEPIRKTTSITGVLRDTVHFALSGSAVKCEFSLPDGLWPVTIDEGQVGQVIQNLTINANQAMPKGGTIKIWAENVAIRENGSLPLEAGRYVRISIKDEGTGIPERNLPKIFDPFFTTKPTGSGLGLSTAFTIIQNHHGYIDVHSVMEEGTTFDVYLPASKGRSGAQEMKKREPIKGEWKILLIDDQELIRESIGKALRRLGWEVKCARHGAEGIALYEDALKGERPFDVVITDLTIPGAMGGKEIIKEFKRIDPDVKVIVSSGYFEDPVMSRFKQYGFSGVIPKPYKIEDLAKVINTVAVGKK